MRLRPRFLEPQQPTAPADISPPTLQGSNDDDASQPALGAKLGTPSRGWLKQQLPAPALAAPFMPPASLQGLSSQPEPVSEPAPPPIQTVAEAARRLGLCIGRAPDAALGDALKILLDTTRPADVHVILDAVARMNHVSLTSEALAQIVMATALNRARLGPRHWNTFVTAAREALHPPSRAHDWRRCVEAFGEAPACDWTGLAQATRMLCGAGWTMDSVMQLLAPLRTEHTRAHWTAFIDAARVLCETSSNDLERSEMLEALCMVDVSAWASLAGATSALSVGLTANASRLPVTRALAHMYAVNRPSDRPSLVAPALRLCTQRMSAWERAMVVRAIGAVVPKERGGMVNLCVPLRDTGVATAQYVAYINTLADTPAPSREHHRDRLLEQARHLAAGQNDGHHVDIENVAVYQRVAKAASSIEALRAMGLERTWQEELASLGRFLTRCLTVAQVAPESLNRVRAGASELQNARRTLQGTRQYFDYSECLVANPAYHYGEEVIGLGELCALVWRAIRIYETPNGHEDDGHRERKNLRISFVTALAQCIEDDGHRVCPVGISQRLLQVLQGYHPGVHLDTTTPQALVCQLTQEFAAVDQALDIDAQPTNAAIAQFVAEARQTAESHFEQGSADFQRFDKDLLGYLEMTYDWNPER